MLIPKFDLCKSEWLELVFDDRNKQYGAYELRQHNGRTMVKAMLITFMSVIAIALVVGVLIRPAVANAGNVFVLHPVHVFHYVNPPAVVPPKPVNHTRASVTPAPAAPAVMHQLAPMVVVEDHHAITPPTTKDLQNGAIGPVNITGPANAQPGNANPSGVSPGGASGQPGAETAPFTSVEVMPVPFGGASAWAKFLSKNLRYPDMAIDQHIQGKVWVSFIIEADGKLSHFKVEKGIGYGLDEEALRVLKLAPAWQPGQQNGHPVRVQYTIPINFQLSDEQ